MRRFGCTCRAGGNLDCAQIGAARGTAERSFDRARLATELIPIYQSITSHDRHGRHYDRRAAEHAVVGRAAPDSSSDSPRADIAP